MNRANGDDRNLERIHNMLQRVIFAPVDLWQKDSDWRPCRINSTTSRHQADKLPVSADVLESALANNDVPTVVMGPDGQSTMVFPLRLPNGSDLVAVANLSASPADLANRLAGAIQREIGHCQELEQNRQLLEDSHREMSSRLEEIVFLQELTTQIKVCEVCAPETEVAQIILSVLQELISAQAIVFLPGDDNSSAAESSESTARGSLWIGPRILSDEQCAQLIERLGESGGGQPVVRNRLALRRDESGFLGVKSLILVQVVKDGYRAGWLLALNKHSDWISQLDIDTIPSWGLSDNEFGTVEAGLLAAAAITLATHGHNRKLFRDNERLLIGIIQSLVSAIDAKDAYTCGHSERVAAISKRVGQELGLEPKQCHELYLAGLLHDIGKIGIPDNVLLKPGKLLDEEATRIKTHPERGYAILRHLRRLENVLPGVLHHHERWDGLGYPKSLAGEEIPLAARIIAVVDSYDAMTSCRPYRKAMEDGKAETILRKGSGVQWDPRVVKQMLALQAELGTICLDANRIARQAVGVAGMQEGPTQPESIVGAVTRIQST